MNQMDVVKGQLGYQCLKPSKSTSLQCRLNCSEPQSSLTNSEYICNRSSALRLSTVSNNSSAIPICTKLYSFLMKNETKFLSPLTASIEEFNAILLTSDPHLSVVISWTALVIDGSDSTNRTAHGQHFIQLRNFYERICCPEMKVSPTLFCKPIHRFKEIQTIINNIVDDEEKEWEDNTCFIGNRCSIEDETYTRVY